MMRRHIFLCALIVCAAVAGNTGAEITPEQIWDKSGRYSIPWNEMSVEAKTFASEKYLEEINYSLANMGKSFKDINPKKVDSLIYERGVGYITYGLVAGKYASYGDYKKAAYYYYKDHLQAWKCSKESARIKPDCWGGAPGEWVSLLSPIVSIYERHNDYKGALPYYREWLGDWSSSFEGKTLEEKLRNLKIKAAKDENLAEAVELIERWEKAKKLAKTEKPIPIDPAVQHHEWFYSPKTAEVLKALDYYNRNRVKFMVEKAVKHKNPAVARKAKEYLENWNKETAEKGKSPQAVPEAK